MNAVCKRLRRRVGLVIVCSTRQLFTLRGNSCFLEKSLSLAYFMGTGGGRAGQMVFLRNYHALIHCEGACISLPLFPSYWEVTVSLTEGRERMRRGRETDGWCKR